MERSPGPVNTYRIPSDTDGNVVDIDIHVPHLRAENLSLQTWGSSYVLASQLHRFDIDTQSLRQDSGIQILELGAGTGLVGLSAAAIWKANLVLTDLEPIVPGLQKNIASNSKYLNGGDVSAACGTLDWNKPTTLTLSSDSDDGVGSHTLSSATDKATIVLSADSIYSEDHPEILSQTILTWLRPGKKSRAIVAYALRVAYLDALRELWERLEAGGLQTVAEGKVETGDEWDDERFHEWSVWKWRDDGDNFSGS